MKRKKNILTLIILLLIAMVIIRFTVLIIPTVSIKPFEGKIQNYVTSINIKNNNNLFQLYSRIINFYKTDKDNPVAFVDMDRHFDNTTVVGGLSINREELEERLHNASFNDKELFNNESVEKWIALNENCIRMIMDYNGPNEFVIPYDSSKQFSEQKTILAFNLATKLSRFIGLYISYNVSKGRIDEAIQIMDKFQAHLNTIMNTNYKKSHIFITVLLAKHILAEKIDQIIMAGDSSDILQINEHFNNYYMPDKMAEIHNESMLFLFDLFINSMESEHQLPMKKNYYGYFFREYNALVDRLYQIDNIDNRIERYYLYKNYWDDIEIPTKKEFVIAGVLTKVFGTIGFKKLSRIIAINIFYTWDVGSEIRNKKLLSYNISMDLRKYWIESVRLGYPVQDIELQNIRKEDINFTETSKSIDIAYTGEGSDIFKAEVSITGNSK